MGYPEDRDEAERRLRGDDADEGSDGDTDDEDAEAVVESDA